MISSIIKNDIEDEIIPEFKESLKSFENKTVLITGANGLIPSYIADTLILNNKNLEIPTKLILLNKNPMTKNSRLSHLINEKNALFITQDVGKNFDLPGGIDIIFHGASMANPKAVRSNPINTIDANVNGLRKLLEYAKNNKVEKFIVFSSFEIYGNPPDEFTPTSEKFFGMVDTLSDLAPYKESKRLSETLAATFYRELRVPVYIARILLAYGPGMRDDGKIITDFFMSSLRDNKIKMKNDGMSKRSFCYISDIIRGLLAIIFRGNVGEAFNLGNDKENITLIELAENIVEVVNNDTKIEINNEISGKSNRFPDISKLRTLNFTPKINLKEGLIRLKSHIEELEKNE